jgi:hypothetical protein
MPVLDLSVFVLGLAEQAGCDELHHNAVVRAPAEPEENALLHRALQLHACRLGTINTASHSPSLTRQTSACAYAKSDAGML